MKHLKEIPYLKELLLLSQQKKLTIYIVGGFLRDHFLDRSGYDFDFTVNKDAIALARAFAKSIKGAFVLLDEEHPCGRVVKKDKNQIYTFDFSNYRDKSLLEDLKLRDFTVNAICLDIAKVQQEVSKHLLDPQKGLKDLKLKVIRMVASRAFSDDPLRLMRAFSLYAQLGFKIEAKTFRQIKKDADLISKVSMERVREELMKVFTSPRAFETLVLMHRSGLLLKVIPQLSVMQKVHQGGYHHLDVWEHSLEVVHQFELLAAETKDAFIQEYLKAEIASGHQRGALLKFACLLHDIGKPQTRKKEVDRMSFHGHEHVGAGITRHIAKQLKLAVKERHFLEDMVSWHLRPGYMANFKKPSERMVFRFLRDTKEEALSVLLLAIADQRSTRGPLTKKAKAEHHRKTCWQVIDKFIESQNQQPMVRLLSGYDLIKKLKLKPSPLFAKILTQVQEAQALGKIATKQEALALAAKIALKK